MKKLFSSMLLLAILQLSLSLQAQIPAHYYGVNSWMPEYVGAPTSPCDCVTCVNDPGFTHYPDGKFYPILKNSTLIQASGVTLLRYGSTTADLNGPTTAQWDEFIDAAKLMGAEPVIQIPFLKQFYCDGMSIGVWNTTTSANNAITNYVTSLVTYIMNTYPDVKYYSIGNEPDRYYPDFSITALSAADIANYFKPISQEIKTIYAGKTVFVIGPDLAEAHITSLMPDLIGGSGDITGQIGTTGTYYCDIYTYHTYPFAGAQSRTNVINHPSATYYSDLGKIRQSISTLGANQNQNLKIGLTEFNINWQNPTNNNKPADVAANSFIAGQWMADMFATGLRAPFKSTENAPVAIMIPWSVHEKSGSGLPEDLGLLNGKYVSPTNLPTGRSTYYHLQLMARNFTGLTTTFLENTYVGPPANDPDIKTYAYISSSETGVLIMNQKQTGGPHSFEIKFDGSTNPTNGDHRIRIAAGNTTTYFCQIKTETTALLKFDSTTGDLISRTDYSLEDAEKLVGPGTWTPNSAAYIPGAYIQDSPHDAGNQGNVETNTAQPGVFWASTDIWNRYPFPNGVTYQFHQNPENTPSCSAPTYIAPNYLYVKIRNNSCQDITGTLNVYYAKAGTGIAWGPVNQWVGYNCVAADTNCSPSLVCGAQIGNVTGITVPANSELIRQITWCPPDPSDYSLANSNCGPAINGEPAHFCFLAHFDAQPADPLPSFLNYNVWDQAYLLNNVAWKNVEIIDNDGSSLAPSGVVWIRNVKESSFVKLRFLSQKDRNGETLLDYARVRLHFTRQFIRSWKKGGRRGEGIVLVNDSVVEITNTNAYMDQIFMKYMETQAVAMQLTFFKSYSQNLNEFFSFDIVQSNLNDAAGKPNGGQRYDVKKNRWKVRNCFNRWWWEVRNCFTSAMRKLIPKRK